MSSLSSSSARSLFTRTRWTLLKAAHAPENQEALDSLCRSYRKPIYLYLRKWNLSHEEAEDVTQQFFLEMLHKEGFEQADPARGRFRSFLLACLKNHLKLYWRKRNRLKRGGNEQHVHLEDEDCESIAHAAEICFDQEWAQTVLSRSFDALRHEYEGAGKPFEELRRFLEEPKGTVPLQLAADQMGISVAALKSAVFRLRRRYAELVRDEIALTSAPGQSVETELHYLFTVLNRESS